MLIKKAPDVASSEITPESLYLRRREFLQAAGLTAAALNPTLFSDIVVHEGASSLSYLLEKPVTYREAPELFCLDLYKYFDFDRLIALAGATRVAMGKGL